MKKKGFTLIELIAVIVILIIIALISIPLVLNVINNSKKEAFKDSIYSVFRAIEVYEAKNEFNKITNEGISITDEKFPLENGKFVSGKIIRNDRGEIELVNVTDGEYCAQGTKKKFVIIKGGCKDETKPVIILNGNQNIKIVVGTEYVELGATAIDDFDGDISSDIEIIGTVNSNKIGTYIITYTVTDKAGNVATLIRTVEVGVPEGYVVVDTVDELDNIRNNPDGKYYLVENIDLTGKTWTPIENFSGIFDGGGNTITGLQMTAISVNNVGLFGTISAENVEIKNLEIVNMSIMGKANVGGLVGNISGSAIIKNVKVSGTINTSGDNVGGIVGYANDVTLENVSSSGTVGGVSYVGGLVGYISSGNIENCYSTADVTSSSSTNHTGGLIGIISSGTVTKSYATGSVRGHSILGGLIGRSDATVTRSYATGTVTTRMNYESSSNMGGLIGVNYGNIENCYSRSNLTSTGSYRTFYVGGLVGSNYGALKKSYYSGSISNVNKSNNYVGPIVGYYNNMLSGSAVYWDTSVTGMSTSNVSGAIGRTTAQMYQQSTYNGWDFESIWQANPNGYPTLR